MPTGKHGLMIALGLGKPKDDESKGSSEKADLAQELIDALDDKDAEGVAAAFEALYMACAEKTEDEDTEEKDY